MYVCTVIVSLLTNKMFPAVKKCELIKNMIQKHGKLKYMYIRKCKWGSDALAPY